MKIALVGTIYPYRGGIAHYTAQLAAYLGQQHTVHVYSFRQLYPSWLFPGRSQVEPGGAPLVDVAADAWLVPWWPLSWHRVQQDWARQAPDLIIMQWWVTFMAPMTASLVAAARRLKIPVAAISHNIVPHEHSRIDAALARLALRQVDGLVVHGAAEQRRAQALLPGMPISAVPFPLYSAFHSGRWSRDEARQALRVDGRVLLFFGFVRPYKGLSDLLEALPAVLQDEPAVLLVVGEMWEAADTYSGAVARLGLSAHVRFVDQYVPNEEVPLYFAAADLVVLPYRHASGSAAAQLAFALGVPVVATRAGSLSETVEDGVTGFLAEPGDVPGLSDAIRRFFSEARAEPFRVAIAQRQGQSSWAVVADSVLRYAARQPDGASAASDLDEAQRHPAG